MSMTLMNHHAARARRMQKNAFHGISTLADWEKVRKERRREFLQNLGLDPMPSACDPKVLDCGEEKGDGYRMRKIGFQILPDCWATANIYYPDPTPEGRQPAVLYVCGHGKIGVWHYQADGQVWARRGYVCLIVDTIEQHDNPGEHHGFQRNFNDLWVSMGYTSSGGETLNSLRALDILAADPHVDPDRIGTTGISGGGALSFYVAAVDERIKAVSTLCGVSTPYDAIGNRRMFSHCDCIYPHNLYGRDICEYAALIAPRAALFCFGNNDSLFHPDENHALVERARKIFKLHGAEDHCQLNAYECGHENHPVFFEATQKWFDRFVAGKEHPILEKGKPELSESQTSPFNGQPPTPNRLHLLPEMMINRGTLPLPSGPGDWPEVRDAALKKLPAFDQTGTLTPFTQVGRWNSSKGSARSLHRGGIDDLDILFDLYEPDDRQKKLFLGLANPGEYSQHVAHLIQGPANGRATTVYLQTRLAGGNFPPPQPPGHPAGGTPRTVENRLRFAMTLTGQSPIAMIMEDLAATVDYLADLDVCQGFDFYLCGRGEFGVAALYHSLRDDRIKGIILDDLPVSHVDGAPIPGILRSFDIPHAVGLMAPRPVFISSFGHGNWNWPTRVYSRIGAEEKLVMGISPASAIDKILMGQG